MLFFFLPSRSERLPVTGDRYLGVGKLLSSRGADEEKNNV